MFVSLDIRLVRLELELGFSDDFGGEAGRVLGKHVSGRQGNKKMNADATFSRRNSRSADAATSSLPNDQWRKDVTLRRQDYYPVSETKTSSRSGP
jgi:hypothetical protein